MSSDSKQCPVCGAAFSGLLDDNCPNCLMRLAASIAGSPEPAPATLAARTIGNYELLDEIARGGMGVVYRARQRGLNRTVAVKLLIGGVFADRHYVERFRREAESAASLNHPHIVAIHEVGEHEGQPYLSMELIEGRSLAEVIREKPPTAHAAAGWVKTIAEAVQYAHERGLLHRDLKPSNVLIDELGAPHISDFGLAKRWNDAHESRSESDLTLTGQVLGSPNYMPPEQADSNCGRATPASDVYSLGAVLYHLLTGRPPFVAETVTQTLRLVMEGDLVPPRLLNPTLPMDLQTICLKCLEADPVRRYGTARELAEELGRFLRDEPIQARAIGFLGRLRRWRRRKPALAASLGLVAGLLLVVLIGLPVALSRINHARSVAELARERAESAERETEARLYTALLEQARATVRSGEQGHRVQALEAARHAMSISNTAELRREVVAALALPDFKLERKLERPDGLSPRGMDPKLERMAWSRGRTAVEIRDTTDQQLLATLPASTNLPASSVTWSADGQFLAVERDHDGAGEFADVEIWNVPVAQRMLLFRRVPWGTCAFHPSQPKLLLGRGRGAVALLNLEDGSEVKRFELNNSPRNLLFSPDGERFAASHPTGTTWSVSILGVTDGSLVASTRITNFVRSLDWHPDGRLLAACDDGGAVHLIDPQSGTDYIIGIHKTTAATVAFSPDGDYLLSGGWENELICWDLRAKRRAFSMRANGYTAQWSRDAQHCAITTDGPVQLHAFVRPMIHREFAEDLGAQRQAAFSPDGSWLAVSGDDRLGVWRLDCESPGAQHEAARRSHLFFDGLTGDLFSNREGSFRRWQMTLDTNRSITLKSERVTIEGTSDFRSACLFSNEVVITDQRGTRGIPLDELGKAAGQPKQTVRGRNGVSPDGRWLAINPSFSPFLYIYSRPNLDRVAKLTNQANVASFLFTPSGDEVIACTTLRLEFWSTKTWQRTRELANFRSAFFAPDGQSCWLTKDYSSAGLYDFRTLEPLLLLPNGMTPLAVSPDGSQLAVTVDNRRLQVWNLSAVRAQLRELKMDWGK